MDGARTIAEACLKCNVERLIHFSALNADQEASSKFLQSKVVMGGGVRWVWLYNANQEASSKFQSYLGGWSCIKVLGWGVVLNEWGVVDYVCYCLFSGIWGRGGARYIP